MKGLLIALVVVGAVGALGYFFIQGIRKVTATASAIHDDVIEPYRLLLQAEAYEKAYDDCLDDALKATLSRETFVAAHRARAAEHGKLQEWIHTTLSDERDIGGGGRQLGLQYVLSYERRDVHVLYFADPDRTPYEIVKFLGSEGNSRSLGPGIW